MVKQAIISVKDAEREAEELIKNALNSAKEAEKEAMVKANQEYNKILQEAKDESVRIREEASKKAEQDVLPLVKEGEKLYNDYLHKADGKIDKLAKQILERIVN